MCPECTVTVPSVHFLSHGPHAVNQKRDHLLSLVRRDKRRDALLYELREITSYHVIPL